jgi:hypothetical protein
MQTKSASTTFQQDPIIGASQPLAEIVLSGRRLSNDALLHIRKAIQDHPDYSSKAGDEAGYNGLGYSVVANW